MIHLKSYIKALKSISSIIQFKEENIGKIKYPKITVIIFSYILTFISLFFLIKNMKPNIKEKISE